MESHMALRRLNSLDVAELRRLWRQQRLSRPAPPLKRVLIRELAWQVQSQRAGGVDAETRRLLRQACRDANIESSDPRRRAKKRARPRPPATLPAGATLVRVWRGQRHVVTVLEGVRFRYRGETYNSLTKIAERITSAHWSGPRFFGLDRVRGMS